MKNVNDESMKRVIEESVPGKQVTISHIIASPMIDIYERLGIDNKGAIGILTISPFEASIIAADIATKVADVEIGFLDRFTGSVIISGDVESVEVALNAVNDNEKKLKSTQDIIYGKNTIYIPGSYIESPWMHKHIITMSQDASHVLILVDQSRCINVYPPGFAKAFRCPVVGVITGVNQVEENKKFCINQLKDIMVLEPYYEINTLNGKGMEGLKNYLFSKKE